MYGIVRNRRDAGPAAGRFEIWARFAGKVQTIPGKAFLRSGDPNCGGRIVFPDPNITREVPMGGVAIVEVPAQKAGEIRFACGTGMYRGSVVAVPK